MGILNFMCRRRSLVVKAKKMNPKPAKVEKDEKRQWAICVTCFK
jgi:hypothetical protein